MKDFQQMKDFFSAIPDDPRLGAYHISLYMSLYHHWLLSDCKEPMQINRRDIMKTAKISGIATYHRCIRELHNYGYIRYMPSYNPVCSTKVFMINNKV